MYISLHLLSRVEDTMDKIKLSFTNLLLHKFIGLYAKYKLICNASNNKMNLSILSQYILRNYLVCE